MCLGKMAVFVGTAGIFSLSRGMFDFLESRLFTVIVDVVIFLL